MDIDINIKVEIENEINKLQIELIRMQADMLNNFNLLQSQIIALKMKLCNNNNFNGKIDNIKPKIEPRIDPVENGSSLPYIKRHIPPQPLQPDNGQYKSFALGGVVRQTE